MAITSQRTTSCWRGIGSCVLCEPAGGDGSNRVLLLEAAATTAAQEPASSSPSHDPYPVGYAQTLKDPKATGLYENGADPGTGGRSHVWPRARFLRMSSRSTLSISVVSTPTMTAAPARCEGWAWSDVFAYFRRAQH